MNDAIREALLEGEQFGRQCALLFPEQALSGLSGSRLGRETGSSIDFQDFRDYVPGDDIRRIDWGVYARSDRLTVKLYREEVHPHLDLIVDGSRSMGWQESEKAARVAAIASLLGTAAVNVQCSTSVWLAGDGCRRLRNDQMIPSNWDGLEFTSGRSLPDSFNILPPRLRRLGIRVLLSDLLWEGDPLPLLRRLSHDAACLWVVQTLSEEDASPPQRGHYRLQDSENMEVREIDVDEIVAKNYQDSLARWQQEWDGACKRSGARFVSLTLADTKSSMELLETARILDRT